MVDQAIADYEDDQDSSVPSLAQADAATAESDQQPQGSLQQNYDSGQDQDAGTPDWVKKSLEKVHKFFGLESGLTSPKDSDTDVRDTGQEKLGENTTTEAPKATEVTETPTGTTTRDTSAIPDLEGDQGGSSPYGQKSSVQGPGLGETVGNVWDGIKRMLGHEDADTPQAREADRQRILRDAAKIDAGMQDRPGIWTKDEVELERLRQAEKQGDDAARKVWQGQRDEHSSFRGMADAALKSGDRAATAKLFDRSMQSVPDGKRVTTVPGENGGFIVTVTSKSQDKDTIGTPADERSQSYRLTDNQMRDMLRGHGGHFDSLVYHGIEDNLKGVMSKPGVGPEVYDQQGGPGQPQAGGAATSPGNPWAAAAQKLPDGDPRRQDFMDKAQSWERAQRPGGGSPQTPMERVQEGAPNTPVPGRTNVTPEVQKMMNAANAGDPQAMQQWRDMYAKQQAAQQPQQGAQPGAQPPQQGARPGAQQPSEKLQDTTTIPAEKTPEGRAKQGGGLTDQERGDPDFMRRYRRAQEDLTGRPAARTASGGYRPEDSNESPRVQNARRQDAEDAARRAEHERQAAQRDRRLDQADRRLDQGASRPSRARVQQNVDSTTGQRNIDEYDTGQRSAPMGDTSAFTSQRRTLGGGGGGGGKSRSQRQGRQQRRRAYKDGGPVGFSFKKAEKDFANCDPNDENCLASAGNTYE